jgi:hypothetical protein
VVKLASLSAGHVHFGRWFVEFVEGYALAELHEEHILPNLAKISNCVKQPVKIKNSARYSLVQHGPVIISRKWHLLAREWMVLLSVSVSFHHELHCTPRRVLFQLFKDNAVCTRETTSRSSARA